MAFDPAQPRDDHGMWTAGIGVHIEKGKDDGHELIAAKLNAEHPLSEQHLAAIRTYKDAEVNYRLNAHLNKGEKLTKRANDVKAAKLRDDLDSAMSKSGLKQDVVLYRGVSRNFPAVAAGAEITAPMYTATSLSRNVAQEFAGHSGAVMVIKAPAGTKGIYISEKGDGVQSRKLDSEREVLLDRGMKFKVTHVTYQKDQVGKSIPLKIHMEVAK